MNKCYDCPRNCGIDRSHTTGYCREGEKIRVAKIIENFMWEEPCISGSKGALAIFFSGCNLRCEFCQNYKISHKSAGEFYSPQQFRELLESFDLDKFSTIDLITPTHFSSLLIEALKDFNHTIPIVWNSGGYEKEETIERLDKIVDVFMPDFKFYDNDLAKRMSRAENYFEVASKAIEKMRQLKKNNIFNKEGVLTQGVLIRHLILPGYIEDSKKILDFISKKIEKPFVSIMGQFTPMERGLQRRLKPLEYKIVLSYAEKIGLKDGYFQDLTSAKDDFIPDF